MKVDDRAKSLIIHGKVVDFFNTIEQTDPTTPAAELLVRTLCGQSSKNKIESPSPRRFADHIFHAEFSKLKSSKPGRMSTLGKEIATLSTSLLSEIFLKIWESRQDVMKALIVGVEGTPYAGGSCDLLPYALAQ